MNPVWIPLSLIVALAALALALRAYPRQPLVLMMLAPAALSLAVLVSDDLVWPLLAVNGALVIVAAADLFTLPRARHLAAERVTSPIFSLGKSQRVELTLINRSARELWVEARDDKPEALTQEPDHFKLILPPSSRSVVHYQLSASRRGSFRLEQVYFETRSRFVFWRRQIRTPVATALQCLSRYRPIG